KSLFHYKILSDTVWKTGLPVRSAVLKPHAGELVVGWVTTSESSLLYVFIFLRFTDHFVGQA
ncbi:hypothetical protein N7472_004733, partial [Penicillium cf. griseofulvum]